MGCSSPAGACYCLGYLGDQRPGVTRDRLPHRLSAREVGLNDDYRYLLIIGLCGGFTTFSTFSADLLHYLRSGAYLQAGGYLLVSIVSALLLVYLGFRWGRS